MRWENKRELVTLKLTNCVEKRTKRKGAETAKDREGERERFLDAKKRRNRKKGNKEVSLAEAQRTQRV